MVGINTDRKIRNKHLNLFKILGTLNFFFKESNCWQFAAYRVAYMVVSLYGRSPERDFKHHKINKWPYDFKIV